ncbi:M1 family metallopeptidase [Companilactobacillus zhongbaensis]|uniref:M1 family metallopeptidase n=1 Tax=Companilactobacillus zhongbaensis TaxID=2486009 RepID=UPI000F7A3CA4|nr:M1 family metallopeptidase [Companilactobacillus zhongbaensis]
MAQITRFLETFEPSHYDVYIDVNRGTKEISGKSTITGVAHTKPVYIHQKNMDIESVTVNDSDVAFTVDNKTESIKIEVPEMGEMTLAITYKAPLTDSMMGIYPSYYEVNGEKKELVGTQFETTFARQAFPCVDEPAAKAKFDLAIKFDEKPGETILANMPEVREENGVHYFDTTVRMSTYLIAFAFGDLQGKETTTKSGVKVGVFSTKAHQPKELDFALDIAKRSIEFFEDFYQTPYPLPHSWQLALPDFSAGAMENWGLVTYREAYLLIDPDNTALDTKQLVATVISHELAHQWFGDLVTMNWWDDLWLNESFANMMEYVAIDAIEPDWNVWELFQTTDVPAALQRDATDGVQSVHVNVENPAEIDSIFDSAIVYAKGARMLVMMRALVGDKALREGLKNYFAAHKYNNAKGADLWNAVGDAAGMDVASIMNTWLEQPGYPIVNAKIVDGKLTLSQQQFFIGEGKDSGRSWKIPLNSNYDVAPTIFGDKEITLGDYETLRKENGKPFRLNVGNNSHFIVKYDDTLMKDILDNLDDVDAISQMAILQDLRLLAEARQISYAEVVPYLKHFSDNQSTVVNSAVYRIAYNLRKFIAPNTDEEKALKKLYGQLSEKQYARLDWAPKAGESIDDQLTRPTILNAALYAENSSAMAKAHKLFEENKNNLDALSADVRIFVLRNEVKNYGSQELVDSLLNEYKTTTDPSYKSDLNVAITSTKDSEMIKKLIGEFENAQTIKPQDLRAWFRGVLDNPVGEQAAWDWIRNDWDWLEATVGGDMEFATFITVITSIFRTPERLKEFKEFFEPKINTPGLTREITMDMSIIETRVELIEDEKKAVNEAINAAL